MKLKQLKIKKVRLRVTIYFTILVIVVILTINFFVVWIFSDELVKQTDYVVQRKTQTIVKDIHGKIAKIRALSMDIKNDKGINTVLSNNIESIDYNKLTAIRKETGALLDYYANSNKELKVSKIIIVDKKNNILDYKYSNGASSESILNDSDFKAFQNSNFLECFSISTFLSESIDNSNANGSKKYISYYTKYWDKEYNRLADLIICIDSDDMFDYIDIFCREIFDYAYIVNSKGELIHGIGPLAFAKDLENINGMESISKMNGTTTINGNKYLIFNKPFSYNTDWNLVGFVSYDGITRNANLMSMTIFIIGSICIIAVIIVSSYIAKGVTFPIIKVNTAIKLLDKGEWPDAVKVNSEDEVKQLVDGFNRMVLSMRRSFDTIIEEGEDKKRAEVKALQFQLELLQSQINPHFIYNTLNTFSYLALKNGDVKLRELIQSFGMLLRSSISVESSFISIAQELSLTDRYLTIQKCRYGDTFETYYSVPEELMKYKIPKLILQPLVENSLFHGIVPKGLKGNIKIEFFKNGTLIWIKIIDDGVGIDNNDISDILNGKRSMYTKGFNNIGLANINERLKLYYGKEYTLKISSKLGMGTTVEFCIPLNE